MASHQFGAGPALPPLRTHVSNCRCCSPIVLENPSAFLQCKQSSNGAAGVASASPRKLIAWMADHLSDPGYSRLLPVQRAPSQALLAPQLDLASVGRRGQRRGIQRGLGRCSCSKLQICPCWPLIAHRPLLGMSEYCINGFRQHADRLLLTP